MFKMAMQCEMCQVYNQRRGVSALNKVRGVFDVVVAVASATTAVAIVAGG